MHEKNSRKIKSGKAWSYEQSSAYFLTNYFKLKTVV
jgi:hypothetical protein